MDPAAFMAMQMDETNSRLADLFEQNAKLLKHIEETTPKGVDFPIDEQTVTSAAVATLNFEKNYPYIPIRSIDFFNKGTDTAYIRINEDAKEIPIEDHEALVLSRPKPTIKYVTLRVSSGTAVIRMVGHY